MRNQSGKIELKIYWCGIVSKRLNSSLYPTVFGLFENLCELCKCDHRWSKNRPLGIHMFKINKNVLKFKKNYVTNFPETIFIARKLHFPYLYESDNYGNCCYFTIKNDFENFVTWKKFFIPDHFLFFWYTWIPSGRLFDHIVQVHQKKLLRFYGCGL